MQQQLQNITTHDRLDDMDNLKNKFTISDLEQVYQVLKKANELNIAEKKRQKNLELQSNCLHLLANCPSGSAIPGAVQQQDGSSGSLCRADFFHCNLCRSLFIPLVNSSNTCSLCVADFCDNCIIQISSPRPMTLCKLCHSDSLQRLKSGEWLRRARTQRAGLNGGKASTGFGTPGSTDLDEIDRLYHHLMTIVSDKKTTRDVDVQVDSARTSPSFDSIKSLSIDNLSKLSLKKVFPAKTASFFGDNFDENAAIASSPNSNSPMSEIALPVNKLLRNSLMSNRGEENDDFDMYRRTKTETLRSSTYSINSDFSVVSEFFAHDLEVHGCVFLSLEYFQQSSELFVTVERCENISIANEKDGSSNPFVQVSLLPEKSRTSRNRTTVQKCTLNPVFQQRFSFSSDKASLGDRLLNVSVWHSQHVKNSLFLGEANVPLINLDLSKVTEMSCNLHVKFQDNPRKVLHHTDPPRSPEYDTQLPRPIMTTTLDHLPSQTNLASRTTKRPTLLELSRKVSNPSSKLIMPSSTCRKTQVKLPQFETLKKRSMSKMKYLVRRFIVGVSSSSAAHHDPKNNPVIKIDSCSSRDDSK